MTTPTKRQQRVMDAIDKIATRQGYPPTIAELMKSLRIKSPNGIKCHLNALRTKGYVTWINGKSRTLRLLPHRER